MPEKADDRNNQNLIRLTREELMGSHVDDLVKRYKSMRGDAGVNRSGRRWYLRNWFVFMCAGAVGACAAWAIIEPFFDDTFYVQGPLEEVARPAVLPRIFILENDTIELSAPLTHFVILRGDTIWISPGTKIRSTERKPPLLDPTKLVKGRETGINVEYLTHGRTHVAIARFITLSPAPNPSKKALLPLARLENRSTASGFLLFPLVAGLIGLFIGAIDGVICRLFRRALLGGSIGFIVGFIGGFLAAMLAGLVYSPFSHFASAEYDFNTDTISTFGFVLQMLGRTLAWGVAGMAMGLGQGAALRSKRLLLYGFLGGVIGGLLGGLLFDPIDMILLSPDKPSAHWSRLIGFSVIGAAVGAMIGVVELLARDAWLRMVEGPLAGKEFLLFKDRMCLGSSPSSDIYLFNDKKVAPRHATLRAVGDECEIENHDAANAVMVNNQQIQTARLRHGDTITIGATSFVFEKRQK